MTNKTNNTGPLFNESIESLQSKHHNTTKAVGDTFVPDGAPAMVNESDRKTGELGGGASKSLRDFATATTGG